MKVVHQRLRHEYRAPDGRVAVLSHGEAAVALAAVIGPRIPRRPDLDAAPAMVVDGVARRGGIEAVRRIDARARELNLQMVEQDLPWTAEQREIWCGGERRQSALCDLIWDVVSPPRTRRSAVA